MCSVCSIAGPCRFQSADVGFVNVYVSLCVLSAGVVLHVLSVDVGLCLCSVR